MDCSVCGVSWLGLDMLQKHLLEDHTQEEVAIALLSLKFSTQSNTTDITVANCLEGISSIYSRQTENIATDQSEISQTENFGGFSDDLSLAVNTKMSNESHRENLFGKAEERESSVPQRILSQMMGLDEDFDNRVLGDLGDDITLVDDESLLKDMDLFPNLLDFVIELDAQSIAVSNFAQPSHSADTVKVQELTDENFPFCKTNIRECETSYQSAEVLNEHIYTPNDSACVSYGNNEMAATSSVHDEYNGNSNSEVNISCNTLGSDVVSNLQEIVDHKHIQIDSKLLEHTLVSTDSKYLTYPSGSEGSISVVTFAGGKSIYNFQSRLVTTQAPSIYQGCECLPESNQVVEIVTPEGENAFRTSWIPSHNEKRWSLHTSSLTEKCSSSENIREKNGVATTGSDCHKNVCLEQYSKFGRKLRRKYQHEYVYENHFEKVCCNNLLDRIETFNLKRRTGLDNPAKMKMGYLRLEKSDNESKCIKLSCEQNEIVSVKPSLSSGIARQTKNDCDQTIMSSPALNLSCDCAVGRKSVRNCPILCYLCLQEQKSPENLSIHLQSVHSDWVTNYDCRCGAQFPTHEEFHQHWNDKHRKQYQIVFTCVICSRAFKSKHTYDTHLKRYHPLHKVICYVCDKRFNSYKGLQNHLPLHTRRRIFSCPYCDKYYYLRYSFNRHFLTHFMAFNCNVCSRMFTSKYHYLSHIRLHKLSRTLGLSSRLRCKNCGDTRDKKAVSKLAVSDHGHHKVCIACNVGYYKPFTVFNYPTSWNNISQGCTRSPIDAKDHCDDRSAEYLTMKLADNKIDDKLKGISDENELVKVIGHPVCSIKDNSRKVCSICNVSVLNLPKHMRRVHEQERVNCDMCGVSVKKDCLPSHKDRMHSRVKNVPCEHCNKVFKNVVSLNEHRSRVRRKIKEVLAEFE